MIWIREFTHDARGRIFGTLFKTIGKPIFTREAKRTVRNLERLEATTIASPSAGARGFAA